MNQIKKDEGTSSIPKNINLPKNTKNNVQSKEKQENELLSNSGTSISSNTDIYKNFVSKMKLNYHLKNPQIHTQTIILHASLDKSYSDLNDSLSQIEINNEPKFDNCFKDKNSFKDSDKLNKGFILDNSSQYSQNTNNLNNAFISDNSAQYSPNGKNLNNNRNNQKRNAINYINKLYEEEKNNSNENILDKSELNDKNNSSGKAQKDNLTINFNNNMFFVNDNNEPKKYPLNILFTDKNHNNENTFKDKVFVSNNPFDDSYPGTKKEQNQQTKLLPYGYQNNSFLGPNQDKNNIKDNNILLPNKKDNLKPLNQNISSLNDLSTNQNTNNYDNVNNDKNDNQGISPFNYGNNNPSIMSFPNLGNSESELNINQNPNNKQNLLFSFNPLNPNDFNGNKENDNNNDINYTSKIFPGKNNNQNNPLNYHPNIDSNNNSFGDNDNQPNNLNPNYIGTTNNFEPNKEYPPKLEKDLNQEPLIEYNDFNNDNIKNNSNNLNQNLNSSLDQINPNNNMNNLKPNIISGHLNPNINTNTNNMNPNNNTHYPLDINTNNNVHYPLDANINNPKVNNIINPGNIIHDENSIEISLENSENLDIEKESKDQKSNILKSLLYGLLFGSATTGLLWLRNEETRKYFMEKFNRINFDSIIYLFKAFLHPIVFFKRIASHEKREVYVKVLGLTFGKFFDFLEEYGDGIRFIGTILSVYLLWFIIKSFIRLAIKMWKQQKKN